MSNMAISDMARDMAREILDDDLFEVGARVNDDGIFATGWVEDFSLDGLDFLERWLQRAYEAGKAAKP